MGHADADTPLGRPLRTRFPPWMLGLSLVLGACATERREGAARARLAECDGPIIDSWYGDPLQYGLLGHAQEQINVLGNVSDPHDVDMLEYRLGDGDWTELTVGPGPDRLQDPGDFNADINRSRLQDGTNSMTLRAVDPLGNVCMRTITLDYVRGTVWPMPYRGHFDQVVSRPQIDQAAQVVDGLWDVTSTGLRTAEPGYDRLLAVGDESWGPGYEARVRLTVHRFSDWGGIGIALGWQGHSGSGNPPTGWPVGALGWVRNKTEQSVLEIRTFDRGTREYTPAVLEEGESYWFEMRSEPLNNATMRVQVRFWNVTDPEPDGWMLTDRVDARDGSVLLVAHAADLTFHEVRVTRPGQSLDAGVPHDAGRPDADATMDAAADAGSPPTDGGTPPMDAGARMDSGARMDAGTPALDAGASMDSGMTAMDAGAPGDADTPPMDADAPRDAGTSPVDADAPVMDAGRPTDADAPPTDGDSPSPVDAGGGPPDSAVVDATPASPDADVAPRDAGMGPAFPVVDAASAPRRAHPAPIPGSDATVVSGDAEPPAAEDSPSNPTETLGGTCSVSPSAKPPSPALLLTALALAGLVRRAGRRRKARIGTG